MDSKAVANALAALIDAVAATTAHADRDGADPILRDLVSRAHHLHAALLDVIRSNEPDSVAVLAGVREMADGWINDLDALVRKVRKSG